MLEMDRRPTRTEAVYDRLRSDILTRRQPPSIRLRFADLAERYDASIGVIREALTRLTAEGLVVSEPQLGFRVLALSTVDLIDLTEARCHIESAALALAITHGSLDWESQLLAAHHALTRTQQFDTNDLQLLNPAWTSAHSRFHVALLTGCPNERLQTIAGGLRDSAELYRHWSARPDGRDVAGEHRQLCEAALDRDPGAACNVLIDHLVTTATALLYSAPDFDAPSLTRLERLSTLPFDQRKTFAERTGSATQPDQ